MYNVQQHRSEAHGAARCTYSGRQTMLYSTPRIGSPLYIPLTEQQPPLYGTLAGKQPAVQHPKDEQPTVQHFTEPQPSEISKLYK
jgi:hypothetical protein